VRALPADAATTVNQLRHAQRQEQRVRAERDQIAAALARAEEDERLRIAGDLHDDTVQTLSSVMLDLEGAMAELDGPALEALGFARGQVANAKLRLHQLMFELLPPDEDDTLRGAIDAYCHGLFVATEIRYELLGDPHPLPHEVNVAAYRLVQAALRNVVRHSQGSRVRIELQRAGGMLVARVSDDGIGLDAGVPVSIGHAGLGILRQRARAAGGVAILGLGLDMRGASVELRLPLEHDPTTELP
jgi:signal transduction histidine kinase